MGIKLVIAEKPSVAKAYADVLGAKTKRDGYYGSNSSGNANQQLNPHKQKTNGEICDKLEICENHTNL